MIFRNLSKTRPPRLLLPYNISNTNTYYQGRTQGVAWEPGLPPFFQKIKKNKKITNFEKRSDLLKTINFKRLLH